MSYSNSANSPEERVEYLETTIAAIIKILKHLGCPTDDIDKMPIEQFIGREFSIMQYYRSAFPIGDCAICSMHKGLPTRLDPYGYICAGCLEKQLYKPAPV